MTLAEAIAALDPANDDHWTADGLPRMDAIMELTGDPSITRKHVTDAAPQLTRSNAAAAVPAEGEGAPTGEGDQSEAATEDDAGDGDEADEADAEQESDDDASGAPGADGDDSAASENEIADESGERSAPSGALEDVFPTLALPVREVVVDYGKVNDALSELETLELALIRKREEIKVELGQVHAKAELLKRAKMRHERARPELLGKSPIQDYLEGQRKAREARAARARRFLDAGTTVHDVAAQLRGGSALDAAMGQRKAARGTQRPTRAPVGGQE